MGKGLDALLGTQKSWNQKKEAKQNTRYISQVDPETLIPSPLQPRTRFRQTPLNELIESIRQHGIIQPLIIRKKGNKSEIIAGERRWRAAKKLKLKHIPIIYTEANDQEVLEMALIENLQRENLNPIEEARGYVALINDFNLSQQDISQHVGKSRASIANAIRLLSLPKKIKEFVNDQKISVGHAKVILSLKRKSDRLNIAQKIISQEFNVRTTEKLVRDIENQSQKKVKKILLKKDSSLKRIEEILQRHFMTKVAMKHTKSKGRIEIEYFGNDDLTRILSLIGVEKEI